MKHFSNGRLHFVLVLMGILYSGCASSTNPGSTPNGATYSGQLVYTDVNTVNMTYTFDLSSGASTSEFVAIDPTWTPDGNVLFDIPLGTFGHHNNGAIGITSVSGTNEKEIVDLGLFSPVFHLHPQISKDGSHISFNYFDGFDPSGNPYQKNSGTTIVTPDGTLAGLASGAFDGSWAPDGSMVLSGSGYQDVSSANVRTPVQAGLYKLDNTFTTISRIDDGTVPEPINPAVSPDGKKIAFCSHTHIWVMDIDGSNTHQVTTGPYFENFVNWSPDGKYLVISGSFTFKFGEGYAALIVPATTINLTISPTGSYWVHLNGGTADDGARIKPTGWVSWK